MQIMPFLRFAQLIVSTVIDTVILCYIFLIFLSCVIINVYEWQIIKFSASTLNIYLLFIYRFFLQKGNCFLNVAPVLKQSSAFVPILKNKIKSKDFLEHVLALRWEIYKFWAETVLTMDWPLITSSRSNSLEPSRKSLNRSLMVDGGLRCHKIKSYRSYV